MTEQEQIEIDLMKKVSHDVRKTIERTLALSDDPATQLAIVMAATDAAAIFGAEVQACIVGEEINSEADAQKSIVKFVEGILEDMRGAGA